MPPLAALGLALLAGGAWPAGQDGREPFAEVDPYTEGRASAMERAGYVSFGPFLFGDGHSTGQVAQTLGGVPLIWVETAHFKLGSSLDAYQLSGDPRERKKIRDELGRLKKRLPRVKTKPREIDPWLRLHLFAQRLEELYADFCEAMGASAADFPDPSDDSPGGSTRELAASRLGRGPHLGMPSKFTVLLLEKESSFARYAKTYLGFDPGHRYRHHFPEIESLFFGTSMEFLLGRFGNDTALHCSVVSGVVQNLVNGFAGYGHDAPFFWREGLAHWFSRRIDPRFPFFSGSGRIRARDDEGEWEPRVRARVEHRHFPPTGEMLHWSDPDAIGYADHMILWSRIDYLMAREDGAGATFLRRLKDPVRADPGTPWETLLAERTLAAFTSATGQDPTAFDEAWCEWVEKSYPAR